MAIQAENIPVRIPEGVARAENAPSRDTEIESDAQLETDLFALIGKMEHVQIELTTEKKHKRPMAAMRVGRELIENVFLFAYNRLESESQAMAFNRAQNIYNITFALGERLNKLSRRELEALSDDGHPQPSSIRAEYRMVGEKIALVLAEYFELMIAQFQDSQKPEQWRSTFQVFLDDLLQRW